MYRASARWIVVLCVLMTPEISMAQACLQNCTSLYVYCNMNAWYRAMPVPGHSCGERLHACDTACGASTRSPTLPELYTRREEGRLRWESYRECRSECTARYQQCIEVGASPAEGSCSARLHACEATCSPPPAW